MCALFRAKFPWYINSSNSATAATPLVLESGNLMRLIRTLRDSAICVKTKMAMFYLADKIVYKVFWRIFSHTSLPRVNWVCRCWQLAVSILPHLPADICSIFGLAADIKESEFRLSHTLFIAHSSRSSNDILSASWETGYSRLGSKLIAFWLSTTLHWVRMAISEFLIVENVQSRWNCYHTPSTCSWDNSGLFVRRHLYFGTTGKSKSPYPYSGVRYFKQVARHKNAQFVSYHSYLHEWEKIQLLSF